MSDSDQTILHSFDESTNTMSSKSFAIMIAVVVLVGVGVGYLLTSFAGGKTPGTASSKSGSSEKVVGVSGKKNFKDQAEGILKEGGIEGEGNFHLERPGGASQNVYLTSTTVDLSEHLNKKVRVWGETFKGDKAGWLMDVGLVEVLQ